jgi:hypothetical protein
MEAEPVLKDPQGRVIPMTRHAAVVSEAVPVRQPVDPDTLMNIVERLRELPPQPRQQQ